MPFPKPYLCSARCARRGREDGRRVEIDAARREDHLVDGAAGGDVEDRVESREDEAHGFGDEGVGLRRDFVDQLGGGCAGRSGVVAEGVERMVAVGFPHQQGVGGVVDADGSFFKIRQRTAVNDTVVDAVHDDAVLFGGRDRQALNIEICGVFDRDQVKIAARHAERRTKTVMV